MEIKKENIKVLYSAEQLQERIEALGKQITADYKDVEEDIVVVGVLRGAFLFFADLCRQLDLTIHVDFLGLSSYGNRTESSGVVKITSDLSTAVVDKHVIVVEDIVDTGLTMQYLIENFRTRKPKTLKICSLLEKPARTIQPVDIDYLGFTIDDYFVIGYGLDFQGKFRNLPYIGYVDGLDDDE